MDSQSLPIKNSFTSQDIKEPFTMPIVVDVRTLEPWHNDVADQIRVEKVNEVAKDHAREIEAALGTLRCPDHPGQDSYITVVAGRINQISIEMRFCCSGFEKKVSLKVERPWH